MKPGVSEFEMNILYYLNVHQKFSRKLLQVYSHRITKDITVETQAVAIVNPKKDMSLLQTKLYFS